MRDWWSLELKLHFTAEMRAVVAASLLLLCQQAHQASVSVNTKGDLVLSVASGRRVLIDAVDVMARLQQIEHQHASTTTRLDQLQQVQQVTAAALATLQHERTLAVHTIVGNIDISSVDTCNHLRGVVRIVGNLHIDNRHRTASGYVDVNYTTCLST